MAGKGPEPAWRRAVPGLLLLLAMAVFARGSGDFGFPRWAGAEAWLGALPVYIYGKNFFVDILHLNFILITILTGMLVRNIIGVPGWAVEGVKHSRLFIKMGIILLGSLYSLEDLINLGTTAVVIMAVFTFTIALFVIWMGRRMHMDTASSVVLSAGCGVCGVSAIVAASPAVKARTADVAYSITTILAFGVACLFTFPALGAWLGLTPHQFGVWVGTGILNSGQVLAASLAFAPGSAAAPSQSLKTGEIYNLTRVLLLPFVVSLLVLLYSRTTGQHTGQGRATGMLDKIPVFAFGFLVMVLLTSAGLFGPTDPPSERLLWIRKLYMWFFTIGLAGLGMQISITEMRKAGGAPLVVGLTAGFLKAGAALAVVKLFVPPTP